MRTYIQTSGRSVFFFLHVAIRNSLRSKYIRQKSNFTKLRCVKFLQVSDFKLLHITIVVLLLYICVLLLLCPTYMCFVVLFAPKSLSAGIQTKATPQPFYPSTHKASQ